MFRSVALFALLSFLAAPVSAHMEMSSPAPRQSKFADAYKATGNVDFTNTAPEGATRTHPCSGKPKGPITATLAAGSTITSTIVGGAPHGGGHCQWSLSYDGGNTFVVITDALRTCPLDGAYKVAIPAGAPSGDAVFAWSWINAIGNREYYMNCADVTITNGGSGFSGPKLLVVDVAGFPTVPEFQGNPNTALDLFNARPTISVGAGGPSVDPIQPPTGPVAPVEPPTEPSHPIEPSHPTNPSTPPSDGPTSCSAGFSGIVCSPDCGTQFFQCANGYAYPLQSTASGTVCFGGSQVWPSDPRCAHNSVASIDDAASEDASASTEQHHAKKHHGKKHHAKKHHAKEHHAKKHHAKKHHEQQPQEEEEEQVESVSQNEEAELEQEIEGTLKSLRKLLKGIHQ